MTYENFGGYACRYTFCLEGIDRVTQSKLMGIQQLASSLNNNRELSRSIYDGQGEIFKQPITLLPVVAFGPNVFHNKMH